MPSLDPIVSLSVALAEAPGTCAFLLGSGVSRDAGVPTGWEIMRAGLHRLHQLETRSAERVDEQSLDVWLTETGREGITYSELLKLIAPDAAVRREYLATFFGDKTPGVTHEALADLAVEGMVRVFVTTNFDRLLEHALQARGIDPVVIASDADLEAAMPREHAPCVVLKPHGDYLRQTIRNTPEEVAELDEGVARELGEVFDRYGVVVLGYSGSDEGVSRALRARRSRYGLWWIARGELGQPATEVVETTGGRVIARETAADFLADLRGRLAVFKAHPSGLTPPIVHDATFSLLEADQRIALFEHLRREGHAYEQQMEELIASVSALRPDLESGRSVWERLRPALERRVASLLPLAVHDADALSAEFARLARGLEGRELSGGYIAWAELPRYAATWLGYVVGALLIRLERFEHLTPLLKQESTDRNGYTENVVWLPGETQHVIGLAMTQDDGQRWLSPGWEHLHRSIGPMSWLHERYPELFVKQEPRRSMAQFDFVLSLAYGFNEHCAAGFYSLGSGGAEELALRLHNDASLRSRVAAALGLTLQDFDAGAEKALADIPRFQGGWSDPTQARSVLANGRAAL